MRGLILTLLLFPFAFQTAQMTSPQPPEPTRVESGHYMPLAELESQYNGWSCGPHVASRVLASHGVETSYEDLMDQALHLTGGRSARIGVHPSTLAQIFREAGLESEAMKLNIEQLAELLRQGRAVPVLIQSPSRPSFRLHWIVVTGINSEEGSVVFYGTDGNKPRAISIERFERLWSMRDVNPLFKMAFPLAGLHPNTGIVLPPIKNIDPISYRMKLTEEEGIQNRPPLPPSSLRGPHKRGR